MGRISVLDQQTVDKIAAGEVVERPASVVKELVENSIDAGASLVTVEIREGGIGFIRITDNGSGMEKEDIPLAFLRHSTSKIRSAEELTGVSSLGFRGEALSSIAAVSMVELITKTREQTLGSRCCLEGGVQKVFEETGAPDGTTLIVRNLFYNTPARKKFLKTEMTEAAAIHEIMTRLALSHPEISFRLMVNGQMKLQTAGNGNLKDVIYHIYGRDAALRLIPVEREEGPMKITGFIGKPEISRGNRNYENYFVNGRFVKSKIIAKGIEDGYRTFLMQHRYPFVCLDIRIDGTLLDVNVHPTKMELRFSDQNLVYHTTERTVREALSGKELIPEVKFEQGKEQPEPAKSQVREAAGKPPLEKLWRTPKPSSEAAAPQDKNLEYFMEQMKKRVEERYTLREENGYHAASGEAKKPSVQEVKKPSGPERPSVQEADKPSGPERPSALEAKEEPAKQLELFDGRLLSTEAALKRRIIGQLFDTYWLVQFGDKLYIIDQHAAHEKVLYERLMKELQESEPHSQLLSPPIILNLSMQEEQLYLRFRQCFAELGFEIEEFGDRAYAVRAVPANLPGAAKEELLFELLDSLSEIGPGSPESLLAKAASMACKAAVKGSHQMSSMEAGALIDELLELENPYNCPHGRPTIISMSKYELEKKFKRIV